MSDYLNSTAIKEYEISICFPKCGKGTQDDPAYQENGGDSLVSLHIGFLDFSV